MRAVMGVLLVLAVVAGVATYSYNLGVAQGLAQNGGGPAPGAGPGPYPAPPYPGYPYGFPYHGPFGFGFFGVVWPILFVFLAFALVRGLFWRGYAWGGPGGRGVPARFEEWHRRAHESKGGAGTV